MEKEREEEVVLKKRFFTVYVTILIMVVILFKVVFMLTVVPTESMAGTIDPGDNVFCTRFGIGEDEIERYDILIFNAPDNPDETYIKRVIGLPGETIEVRNGRVYADGQELEDSFINAPQNRRGDGVYMVPEGHYFFLGDNRNKSNDSRFWKKKYVPVENIKAKARCVIYPFADAGWL